jgi:molybdopterin-guanine dinucleotide biosynthesis protein A
MYYDVTGIILAGGKSSRMGVNKAMLKYEGMSIIEHTAELMRSLFPRVIIITNDTNEYKFLGLEMFKDLFPGNGPLGGIHSGLSHSKTEKNFIVSCDMPLISKELVQFITEFKTAYPITLARAEGHIQQLCGIYSRSVLKPAESLCKNSFSPVKNEEKRRCRVLNLINTTGAEIIESFDIPFYSDDMFMNMNKPEDYELLLTRRDSAVENGDNFI